MIRMGVSGWMFLLVPAYPGGPGQKAVKRLCVRVCVCVCVSKCLSYGAAYQKLHSAVFMLPEKDVPSAVVGTVRGWCRDYAAGLEESSTGEVPRLQKFCCHNYWVFAAFSSVVGEGATLRFFTQQLNIFVTFVCEAEIVHAIILCMHHRRYRHFCQIVSMPGLSFSNTVFQRMMHASVQLCSIWEKGTALVFFW